jgi:hypothetical protein
MGMSKEQRDELRRLCEADAVIRNATCGGASLGMEKRKAELALIAAARNVLPALIDEADARDAEVAELKAEVTRLHDALDNFGQHEEDCRGITAWVRANGKPCTCGLIAALAEVAP